MRNLTVLCIHPIISKETDKLLCFGSVGSEQTEGSSVIHVLVSESSRTTMYDIA